MKKVYSSPDSLMIGHLKNVLEANGIPAMLKNEHLPGLAGGVPVNECWIELWILSDIDLEQAEHIIQTALQHHTKDPLPEWQCPSCGETIEGQFARCWNCGTENDLWV
ncbi:MAG: DUF2007 domain-containing protein [Gemmatimonadetes bacterium]|nr:MAG: DUF2007 domain-containing protein [Gemmatimonadota bacterium]